MKLDPADIADLQPLIAAAVECTIDAIRSREAKLDGRRIGYPEGEAAELLGVRRHVLRDARLRGEIAARRLGKSYCYSRESLLKFLAETK